MANELFDRRVKVTIASPLPDSYAGYSTTGIVTVENLRVQFKVKKDLDKSPNTAEINITNLSEKTRSALQTKGARVILQAGYRNALGTIFVGDARTIDHTREGSDWVTKIQCGDGERGMQHARVSESFGPGVKVPGVVTTLADALGFDIGDSVAKLAPVANKQFVNGYSAYGRASTELDKILRAHGFTWSVQDGRIQILRPGDTNTERIILLTPESGLIGSPEFSAPEKAKKSPVLKFKALLQSEIRPGGRLAFQSERHRGTHKVMKVAHSGDTAGGDWYTEGECEISS